MQLLLGRWLATASVFVYSVMVDATAWGAGRMASGGPAAPSGYWVLEQVPQGQPEPVPAHHAFFVELGGAAILYSVNYEYRPVPELGLRTGAEVFPLCLFGKCETILAFPISGYAILGQQNHHLELGGGVTLTSIDDSDARFIVWNLGYRYERPEGGFLFRASFTPLMRVTAPTRDILPMVGLSSGFGF